MSEQEAISTLRAAGWAVVPPVRPFRSVSLAEAAERLGCSVCWVRRNLEEFRGAFRLGSIIRVPESDLEAVARRRRIFATGGQG